MELDKALKSFSKQAKELVEAGHTINDISCRQLADGRLQVRALSPDPTGGPAINVFVSQREVMLRLVELAFNQAYSLTVATHKMKTMPSLSDQEQDGALQASITS
jgi:hypothetical protein